MPDPPTTPKTRFTRFFAVVFLLGIAGCGKKATAEDCERIVVRMTELELRANDITDPQLVQQQVELTKRSFQERTMKECVGRQISRTAMACIETATSPTEILGECLN